MILKLIKKIRILLNLQIEIDSLHNKIDSINNQTILNNKNDNKNSKILLGKLLVNEIKQMPINLILNEYEFQVYSQWGDDGIIQYLINNIEISNKTFIEFGVENYLEANTRFLLINNNWTGLVLDGSLENINYIKSDDVFWKYNLHVKQAFITKDNINDLLKDIPFEKEVGILSIDIDGNDYWVWDAITEVEADIVIIEYNSCFGENKPWTIPYDPKFVRKRKFPDMNYFGVSLLSLCDLGATKGYSFVGCNSNGNNAYFVKTSKLGKIKPLTCEQGFIESKFREVGDQNNYPLYGNKRLESLKGFSVYNTRENKVETV